MRKKNFRKYKTGSGFSLAEILAALTIGAMVLVAVLSISSRVEESSSSINYRLDVRQLPYEVLQRIAEDIDKIVAPTSDNQSADTRITVKNKIDNLYRSAQLIISRTYYDNNNKKQTFEEITWQTNYDFDANSLILYRSRRGIAAEDKLLDEEKEDWEKELYVPICDGITLFKVQVPRGGSFVDSWDSDSLPPGVVVEISFSEPLKQIDGSLDVPEEEKTTRTITINRTREIKFKFIPPLLKVR